MKHLTQGNLFRDSGEGKVVPDDIPGVLPVQRCEEDPDLSEEGAPEELVPTVHSSCLLPNSVCSSTFLTVTSYPASTSGKRLALAHDLRSERVGGHRQLLEARDRAETSNTLSHQESESKEFWLSHFSLLIQSWTPDHETVPSMFKVDFPAQLDLSINFLTDIPRAVSPR